MKTLLSEVKIPLVVAFIARVVFMLLSENYFNGDSGARLQIAYQWMHFPTWFCGYDWLPLHFYLLGAVMKLSGSVDWAPRIFTMILGGVSIIPFYAIVKRVFGKENAWYSSIVVALLGAHIQLSVVTLTEIPSLFFLLWAIYFLLRSFETEKTIYLVLCIFSLACLNLIRFEGWMYTILIGFILLLNKTKLKQLSLFVVLSSLIPLWVLFETWHGIGDPFRGLNYSDYEVQKQLALEGKDAWRNMAELPFVFTSFALLTVTLGMVLTIRSKLNVYYALLFLIPFFYAFYKVIALTLTGQFRYFLISSVFSIPYTMAVMHHIVSLISVRWIKRVATIVFIWFMINPGIVYCIVSPLQDDKVGVFPKGFKESAYWAKEHLSDARVFLDNRNFSANQWMIFANMVRVYGESKAPGIVDYITGRYWVGEVFNEQQLAKEILSKHISHLVFFYDGEMKNKLGFEQQEEKWRGITFKKIYEENGYLVYKAE